MDVSSVAPPDEIAPAPAAVMVIVGVAPATIDCVVESTDTFPAGSVLVALITYVPSVNVDDDVIDHTPLDTTSEPILAASAYKIMVFPFTPVPVIVGVGSMIGVEIAFMMGAFEAVLSTVNDELVTVVATFPASSEASAVTVYDAPFVNACKSTPRIVTTHEPLLNTDPV